MLFHFTLFSLCVSHEFFAPFANRPLSRRLSFPISHSTHLQMSQFWISRLTHNRRLSRKQVLLVLAALILPCVLPLVMSLVMAPQATACFPASRPSYVIFPDDRLGSLLFSPTVSQAFRVSSASSTISQLVRQKNNSYDGVDARTTSAICGHR